MLRVLDFCHGYIDDIIIASKDEEEHQKRSRIESIDLPINFTMENLATVTRSYYTTIPWFMQGLIGNVRGRGMEL